MRSGNTGRSRGVPTLTRTLRLHPAGCMFHRVSNELQRTYSEVDAAAAKFAAAAIEWEKVNGREPPSAESLRQAYKAGYEFRRRGELKPRG